MNKRYPARQTVMSVMLVDSTYDVLTEVWACLSIPFARGSSMCEGHTRLALRSQAVTVNRGQTGELSHLFHIYTHQFIIPDLQFPHTETCGASRLVCVWMWRLSYRETFKQVNRDLNIIWGKQWRPQFDLLRLQSAWANLYLLDSMHWPYDILPSWGKSVLQNQHKIMEA